MAIIPKRPTTTPPELEFSLRPRADDVPPLDRDCVPVPPPPVDVEGVAGDVRRVEGSRATIGHKLLLLLKRSMSAGDNDGIAGSSCRVDQPPRPKPRFLRQAANDSKGRITTGHACCTCPRGTRNPQKRQSTALFGAPALANVAIA